MFKAELEQTAQSHANGGDRAALQSGKGALTPDCDDGLIGCLLTPSGKKKTQGPGRYAGAIQHAQVPGQGHGKDPQNQSCADSARAADQAGFFLCRFFILLSDLSRLPLSKLVAGGRGGHGRTLRRRPRNWSSCNSRSREAAFSQRYRNAFIQIQSMVRAQYCFFQTFACVFT